MKAVAFMEETMTPAVSETGRDAIIHFEEGLIGFSDYKSFVIIEREDIAPFRILQSVDSADVTFMILDPVILVPNYYNQVPAREWEAQGIHQPSKRLAKVIAFIGSVLSESSANLQAPILVNYEAMTARQVILTDSGLSARHPLG